MLYHALKTLLQYHDHFLVSIYFALAMRSTALNDGRQRDFVLCLRSEGDRATV
jgi:hypothetical protein